MSKSLDPDQARHIVGPDLGPNCLQRLWQMTLVAKEFLNEPDHSHLYKILYNVCINHGDGPAHEILVLSK